MSGPVYLGTTLSKHCSLSLLHVSQDSILHSKLLRPIAKGGTLETARYIWRFTRRGARQSAFLTVIDLCGTRHVSPSSKKCRPRADCLEAVLHVFVMPRGLKPVVCRSVSIPSEWARRRGLW
jgi:hypothetical protein